MSLKITIPPPVYKNFAKDYSDNPFRASYTNNGGYGYDIQLDIQGDPDFEMVDKIEAVIEKYRTQRNLKDVFTKVSLYADFPTFAYLAHKHKHSALKPHGCFSIQWKFNRGSGFVEIVVYSPPIHIRDNFIIPNQ